MNKKLYLECYSGISGDMTVAALLDLGVDEDKLLKTLKQLNISNEFDIKITKVNKSGIMVNDFDVILKEHHHTHRNLDDVYEIIDRLDNNEVKVIAKKIFLIVAEAEALAHGKSIDEVHFHEVGAIDSIIDIVSTAFCLVDLNIDNVYVSTLYEGEGFVECAHGLLPVPVPAVLNIVNKYNIPLKITDHEGELITPTGAAIVAAVKNNEALPSEFKIINTGLGAGKRYPNKPSILRAMIIEEEK